MNKLARANTLQRIWARVFLPNTNFHVLDTWMQLNMLSPPFSSLYIFGYLISYFFRAMPTWLSTLYDGFSSTPTKGQNNLEGSSLLFSGWSNIWGYGRSLPLVRHLTVYFRSNFWSLSHLSSKKGWSCGKYKNICTIQIETSLWSWDTCHWDKANIKNWCNNILLRP